MRVASLRDRLLAALVDGAVVILGMAVVVGLVVGGVAAYFRVQGATDEDHAEQDEDDPPLVESSAGFKSFSSRRSCAPRSSACLRVSPSRTGTGAALVFRVVGLRRVDAATRGPIGVRGVLIGALAEQARRAATRPLFRSRAQRERDRNRISACGWQVAGPILSQLVLAVAIRNGRTVYDRLTGTIVVLDR